MIIDRAFSAVRLSTGQIADWAADKRVFISSVMEGLTAERRAVAEAVSELGVEPVWFEEFGGRDQDPEQAYVSEVDSSDVYVGILGSRYGRQNPETGFSATHAEYLRAVERGLRVSVWVLDVDDMAGHQRDFLAEVRTYFTTETVDGPDRLASRVADRLGTIAAEDVAPWCKVGNIIFRAGSIRDDGTTITIDANVRDGDVAHALQRLRPDGFDRSRQLTAVVAGTVATVRVDSLASEMTAGTSTRLSVKLTRNGNRGGGGSLTDAAYSTGTSTYSPDDLTAIGLRVALFEEPNPLGHMSSFADVGDPVGPLREMQVSEESLRPILRLMLTEALVGSGRASRIVKLLVGPRSPGGGRRLLLEWETPGRFGRASERRQVEGRVEL